METIPYRKSKILIQTIPKDTLMFRMTNKTENDIRGIPREDGTRCIIPNFNVFFYPNPFTGKVALKRWTSSLNRVQVYKLIKDIKVIRLLKPGKHTRATKNTQRNFIKRCSTVRQGCLSQKNSQGTHASFNPCLSDTMIKKFPDVVGMLAIAYTDSRRLSKGIKQDKRATSNLKYIHNAKDESGVESVPELILYPLAKRSPTDVIVKPEDELDNNYELLKTFNLNDENKLRSFMDKETTYDPNTYFYMHRL
jgi:hypothetical protein